MFDLGAGLFSVLPRGSAYLDPGSGSFLLQLLIAGLAGIGIFIGASWSRLKRWLQGKKHRSELDGEQEDTDEYDD